MNLKRILAGLLALAIAFPALAQEDDLSRGRERNLAGHGFLPSIYVTDPWVGSTVRTSTGGGMAMGLKTPFYNLDGEELFTLEGDLFYAALGVGYQQKLGTTNAIGLSYSGNARTGTNTYSVIAEGANVDRSIHAWYKKRLHRGEKSQFSVGVDWDYAKIFLITPEEFARAIANGEDLDTATLMRQVKGWTARITMDYARAFSPTFALRANAAMGLYEEPLTADTSKATHRLGLILEMDLQHKYKAPLGITLGRTQGFPDHDPTAGLSGTLLGLWYTGREDFMIGVETGFMSLPIQDQDDKVDALFGLMNLRYYF